MKNIQTLFAAACLVASFMPSTTYADCIDTTAQVGWVRAENIVFDFTVVGAPKASFRIVDSLEASVYGSANTQAQVKPGPMFQGQYKNIRLSCNKDACASIRKFTQEHHRWKGIFQVGVDCPDYRRIDWLKVVQVQDVEVLSGTNLKNIPLLEKQ